MPWSNSFPGSCTDTDKLYVKMDDDLVWLGGPAAFHAFVTHAQTAPNGVLVGDQVPRCLQGRCLGRGHLSAGDGKESDQADRPGILRASSPRLFTAPYQIVHGASAGWKSARAAKTQIATNTERTHARTG